MAKVGNVKKKRSTNVLPTCLEAVLYLTSCSIAKAQHPRQNNTTGNVRSEIRKFGRRITTELPNQQKRPEVPVPVSLPHTCTNARVSYIKFTDISTGRRPEVLSRSQGTYFL